MTYLRHASLAVAGLVVLVLSAPANEAALKAKAKESEERIKADLGYLASDELEGRGRTTAGIS